MKHNLYPPGPNSDKEKKIVEKEKEIKRHNYVTKATGERSVSGHWNFKGWIDIQRTDKKRHCRKK